MSTPYELFSDTWTEAWRGELESSVAYREAAADWQDTLVLRLEADPELGFPEQRAVFLDLDRGQCRAVRVATSEDQEQAAFVISAAGRVWAGLLSGSMDPLGALMMGKLRLAKGGLGALMPHARAAKEMVVAAGNVPTRLPSDSGGGGGW